MNVPLVKIFVRILTVPPWILLPGVTMVAFVGIFSLTGSYFDLLLMVGFGIMGYIFRKLDVPTVPTNTARDSGQVSRSVVDLINAFLSSPGFATATIAIVIALLAVVALRFFSKKKP